MRCAAFHSRRESITGERPTSFPEENSTMPYSGFEPELTRLQAEVLIATNSTEQQVEELIRAERRVTNDSIATAIGCYHGLACNIMYDRLNFQKVCARRVNRQLTVERRKKNRMGICFHLFGPQKQHLVGKQFADDDDIQHDVPLRMMQQHKEFYAAGIKDLLISASTLLEIIYFFTEEFDHIPHDHRSHRAFCAKYFLRPYATCHNECSTLAVICVLTTVPCDLPTISVVTYVITSSDIGLRHLPERNYQ
ncbi:hypothetical protein TNCV_3423281 [Trichonephila clavipes]|nr:hypothetical protein TNCV_3423281 [Trichonephila clavipes]